MLIEQITYVFFAVQNLTLPPPSTHWRGHTALLALLNTMQIMKIHLQVMLLLLQPAPVAVDQLSGVGLEGCKTTPSMAIAAWLSAWARSLASPLPSSNEYCNTLIVGHLKPAVL